MHLTRSRWLILAVSAIVVLLAATACGGKDDSTPPPADTPVAQATAVVEDTATPTPVPPTPTAVPPTATPTVAAEATDEVTSTTVLPDVPVPDDAQNVTYEFEELLFSSPSDVATLLAFYRSALSDDNWQEETDTALVNDALAYTSFDRDGETIGVTIIAFDGASEATIDLSGAPSLSGSDAGDEDMAGGSGYTIADWPTPSDATNIDVTGDTLTFNSALSLAEIAEFYRPTFETMDLGTSCLDDAADYTSISCSYSNGDIAVNFFAFEGFDDTEVEIEFTNYALETPAQSTAGTGELGVENKDGFPMPDDYTSYASEGSNFRTSIEASSPSDLGTLTEFFQTQLADSGWTLEDGEGTDTSATLRFSGPDGDLTLDLTAGDETTISMVLKDAAAAEEAGILPPAGQARVYLVNFADIDLTVSINGEEIDVAAGAGMESPEDAPTLDLSPGEYEVTTTVDGNSVTDQITLGADEVWGLLLDEQGALPLQMF